jgi:hypothetical protein
MVDGTRVSGLFTHHVTADCDHARPRGLGVLVLASFQWTRLGSDDHFDSCKQMQSLAIENPAHNIGQIAQSLAVQHVPDANLAMNGFSQCDTICDDGERDEQTTEEETDVDDDNQADRAEDRSDMTDLSSERRSDSTDDSVSNSRPSPDIEDMLKKIPDMGLHYKVLRKIGEGTNVSLSRSKCRHFQFCL